MSIVMFRKETGQKENYRLPIPKPSDIYSKFVGLFKEI